MIHTLIFRCDTVKKLQNKLDTLRMSFNDPLIFKSIYRYAYDFARVSFTYIIIQAYYFIKWIFGKNIIYVIVNNFD